MLAVCFCFSLVVCCLYVANCMILGWLLWVVGLLFVVVAVCGIAVGLSCGCSFRVVSIICVFVVI